MSFLRRISRAGTHAPPALLRLAVALDAAVDGVRALQLQSHIGGSRLGDLLPTSLVTPFAIAELAAATLLAIGLFTRPAAILSLALAAACAVSAFKQVGGLGSGSAIDTLAHAALIGAASFCLAITGAGKWSVSARSH